MFTLKIKCADDAERDATATGFMDALQGHMEHEVTMLMTEPTVVLKIGKPCPDPQKDYILTVE